MGEGKTGKFGRRNAGTERGRTPRGKASLAAASVLAAGMALPAAAWAQSVTTTGDVNPSPAVSPDWNLAVPLSVGFLGTGSLSVEAGGTVSAPTTFIGGFAEGTATVTGAGSALTSTVLYVGFEGKGTLDIEDGAVVTAPTTFIGGFAEGTVTVTGAGSALTSNTLLYVGFEGKGTLNVEDGATVSAPITFIGGFAEGTATVTGAGSSLTSGIQLYVGFLDKGTLNVEDGASVTAPIALIGGFAEGTATVTGTESSLSADTLYVGFGVKGTLNITDGGSVSDKDGYLGFGAASTATVSGAGSIWSNSASLHIDGGSTLVVTDDGVVKVGADGDGQIDIASAAGSAGTLAIGAKAGDAAAAAGTLEVGTVLLGDGTGTLVINHTATSAGPYELGIDIASTGNGTSAIDVYAGVTRLTGDDSGFKGLTTVHGGTLLVGAEGGSTVLGGDVMVESAGTLGGYGRIGGNLTVAGTLAPGNSIGTLSVGGNAGFDAGATYAVELNTSTGAADKTVVDGAATITDGAVLDVERSGSGPYLVGTRYTVLTAAGGITGLFDLTGDTYLTPFYELGLVSDGTTMALEVEKTTSFTDAALTFNQRNTAAALDRLPEDGALSFAVGNQASFAAARAAFDLMSGELYASAKTVFIEDSRFVRNAMNDRLRAATDAAGAVSTPALAYVKGMPTKVAPTHDGLVFWATGFGSWGSIDTDGNAASLDSSTAGLLVGADAPVGDWRLGFLAGYSGTSFSVDDRASSGSSDNYHVGLYGGTAWGALSLRTGAAYTWQDVSTTRTVAFPGLFDQLSGDYGAGTAQVFGELGWRTNAAGFAFEPFANLAYVNLDTQGLTETGGIAALTVDGDTTGVTFTTLGLRASAAFDLGSMAATARGTLGWRHAFGDTTPLSVNAFELFDAYTVAGVPIAEDAAVVEAGLDIKLSAQATLGLVYAGQFASDATDNGGKASLTWKF
ncbi:autotransporter domain-containing protein [Xanthobacter autotrophicus]|uniref:autotransporter outer membrane beta-barrel domain-containing protein n=1 Tax=Xanthobacter TaxID=279 RepID=UPI0024AADA57|nr:autotransporter domain-containing protein [Xanthobacter autotrophicus]MDI4666806.1 autotransporter domain-containing protein [Xanthobacter autotrophicus]